MHYLFRNTLLSALLMTLLFAAVAVFTGFVFTVAVKDPAGAFAVFRRRCIPSIGLSVLPTPLFYYPVKAIDGKLR